MLMTTLTPSTSVHSLDVPQLGHIDVTVSDRGTGRPYLILHGGAGPQSVAGFAELLGTALGARVIAPTHPGFGGTSRPSALDSVRALAGVYAALLERLDLRDVTIIGNSIGGWIACELALLAPARLARIVLVGPTGIEVEGHPVANVFALTMPEIMQLSYYDPAPFRIDPATIPDAQKAVFAANRAALAVYGGQTSGDPTLRARLARLHVPTLILYGAADRIVDASYRDAFAAAIPGARLEVLAATGHVPQIETPARLLEAIRAGVH